MAKSVLQYWSLVTLLGTRRNTWSSDRIQLSNFRSGIYFARASIDSGNVSALSSSRAQTFSSASSRAEVPRLASHKFRRRTKSKTTITAIITVTSINVIITTTITKITTINTTTSTTMTTSPGAAYPGPILQNSFLYLSLGPEMYRQTCLHKYNQFSLYLALLRSDPSKDWMIFAKISSLLHL